MIAATGILTHGVRNDIPTTSIRHLPRSFAFPGRLQDTLGCKYCSLVLVPLQIGGLLEHGLLLYFSLRQRLAHALAAVYLARDATFLGLFAHQEEFFEDGDGLEGGLLHVSFLQVAVHVHHVQLVGVDAPLDNGLDHALVVVEGASVAILGAALHHEVRLVEDA